MKNNNLSGSFKKFIGNKNTVTIVGVLLCIVILYIGYNYRISKQTALVSMPVAADTILPKTLITEEMVSFMSVPSAYVQGEYYTTKEEVVGMYSSYNSIIAKGSLFYKELLKKEDELPDAWVKDIPKGHLMAQFNVNMETTYGNSIMPGNAVNVYFRAFDDSGSKVYFGKFLENAEVYAVKDANGNNVFEASQETRTPAYVYIAVKEYIFEVVGKMNKMNSNSMEFLVVPVNVELKEDNAIDIKSEDIRKFILDKSVTVDSNVEQPDLKIGQ